MKRTRKKVSPHYLKIVEWSEEDGCYVGRCPELFIGGVHGRDEAKVYAELCQAVDEWLELYKKEGLPLPKTKTDKDYSGKFVVRVGKPLHEKLAVKALYEGESLNNYVKKVLEQHA
jgi:predicted HicB family RNase H-like nuclease